jgi:hypothetical protein
VWLDIWPSIKDSAQTELRRINVLVGICWVHVVLSIMPVNVFEVHSRLDEALNETFSDKVILPASESSF